MLTLFALFFVLILIGVPVAIAIGLSALSSLLINGYPVTIIAQKMITGIDSFTFVAIPLFILAGELMNVGKITDRIFSFAKAVVGWIPGGLAHANIMASVIFAGMSGSAIADAGGLGTVEMKAMREAGYDDYFSGAVTAASSTIGPIFPPSIPMVIYVGIASVSIGKLFIGGVVPGLLMAGALMAYALLVSMRRGYPRGQLSLRLMGQEFAHAFIPLMTPVIILRFIDRGARVAIFNRRIPEEAALKGRFPIDSGQVIFCPVDITDKASIKDGLETVMTTWGVPHVLINNAGLDTQPSAPPEVSGPFEDFPEDVWREVLEVNMTGTFFCCQVIGGAMARAGRGSIVNVGSIYGMLSPVQPIYAYKEKKTGMPFVKPVAYCASKSGLYNFTRYLATYWGQKGVRVNILTPSGVRRDSQDAEFQANYCKRMPVGRMAEEDEFNGAIVFLASDASRYMTGANLVVDGGWTAW